MIYLDTSFITPYYLNETSSPAVSSVLSSLPVGQLVVSEWTRTEFASLLARRERMNELSSTQVQGTMQIFSKSLQTSFKVIQPSTPDFRLASDLLLRQPALGLRGPDALHLAIAVNYTLPIYTLDQGFIRAAMAFGYQASDAGLN